MGLSEVVLLLLQTQVCCRRPTVGLTEEAEFYLVDIVGRARVAARRADWGAWLNFDGLEGGSMRVEGGHEIFVGG